MKIKNTNFFLHKDQRSKYSKFLALLIVVIFLLQYLYYCKHKPNLLPFLHSLYIVWLMNLSLISDQIRTRPNLPNQVIFKTQKIRFHHRQSLVYELDDTDNNQGDNNKRYKVEDGPGFSFLIRLWRGTFEGIPFDFLITLRALYHDNPFC